jgi:UPF0755 protein
MVRGPLLAAALVGLAAAAGAGVAVYWTLWRPLDNPPVELEIPEGWSASRILDRLADQGLLRSRTAGRLYLAAAGGGRSVRYGRYLIPAAARPAEVLERLLEGRVETVAITVVEGSLAAATAELCAAAGVGTAEQWRQVLGRGDWLSDLAPGAPSLEGFLFPDTYRFAVGVTAEAAARHMVERFSSVWQRLAPGSRWSGSALDVVTLASLVEAETPLDRERRRIAGVFLNRLQRGMPLQCDPTVVYALRRRGEWQGLLLRQELAVDDPYNTYRHRGLPPGPINCPGAAALAAALDPDPGGELYFVARPGGGHTFSHTLGEHNRAVAELRRSRR